MSGPTLLVKGSLVAQSSKEQKQLDTVVPINYIMDWFRNHMSVGSTHDRVLVLRSDTGSGKSTAFPSYLFKTFFKQGAGGIACAQPRVLNAISIVQDLVSSGYYNFFKLGENIGWQTGPSKRTGKHGLTYMTIGVLAMIFKSMSDEQIMHKYRFIIVDEVHEASLEQAMLLFTLRNFIKRNSSNKNLPYIILMSATFDANKFLDYFNVNAATNLITVAGFTYPLEERWELTAGTADYLKTASEFIMRIHNDNLTDTPDNADILVFLPGLGEIKTLYTSIETGNKKLAADKKPVFMPLIIVGESVSTRSEDYLKLFAPHQDLMVEIDGKSIKPKRRVILSTNVAETGVTIETLKYVIDCGFNRTPEFNPNFNTHTLLTKAATKSMIRQRMGRANRKSIGIFYPLYPKYVFDKLDDIALGSIETNDMSTMLLSLLYEQIRKDFTENKDCPLDVSKIDMLDMPPSDSLTSGIDKLYQIGFVSPISDYQFVPLDSANWLDRTELTADSHSETPKYSITQLGVIAAGFHKLSPESIRMILAGYAYDMNIRDLISIASWCAFDTRDFNNGRTIPDWIKIYREGLPKHFIGGLANLAGIDVIYRVRLLIADSFIDGLILFNAAAKIVLEALPHEVFEKLAAWCDKVNVKYATVIRFIQLREEIIENLISIGLKFELKPRLVDEPDDRFIKTIVKLKQCIYDGYRCNIATFCPRDNTYKNAYGLSIGTPDMFTVDELKKAEQKKYNLSLNIKPKYIIYDKISMRLNPKNQMYTASVSRVSMLDGFVNHDLTYA